MASITGHHETERGGRVLQFRLQGVTCAMRRVSPLTCGRMIRKSASHVET